MLEKIIMVAENYTELMSQVQSALYILTHLIPKIILRVKYLHFIKEET